MLISYLVTNFSNPLKSTANMFYHCSINSCIIISVVLSFSPVNWQLGNELLAFVCTSCRSISPGQAAIIRNTTIIKSIENSRNKHFSAEYFGENGILKELPSISYATSAVRELVDKVILPAIHLPPAVLLPGTAVANF